MCFFQAASQASPSARGRRGMAHSVEEATFDIQPYKLHLLEEGPATTTTLTRADALAYYR